MKTHVNNKNQIVRFKNFTFEKNNNMQLNYPSFKF